MIEIKDLLSRFSNLIVSGEGKKNLIKEAIYEVTGVQISTDKIKLKNNVIYLEVKPIFKNEIFLKKEKIFHKIAEKTGNTNVPVDIR
jgi:NAD/NADP transhydrogenase alpha subunit